MGSFSGQTFDSCQIDKFKIKVILVLLYIYEEKCFDRDVLQGCKNYSYFEQLTVNVHILKYFPITGLEPQTSGIGSDRSAN